MWWQIMGGTACAFIGMGWLFLIECIIPRVEYDEETDRAIVKIRKEGKKDENCRD